MSPFPTNDEVKDVYDKARSFFSEDFIETLKSHISDNHTYMYGKSVLKFVQKHEVQREVAIYVLMGSNRRESTWGELTDKFSMEPLKDVLSTEMLELIRKEIPEHQCKVYFTDRNKDGYNDGNFKVKVIIDSNKKSDDTETDGFTRVGKTVKSGKPSYAKKASLPPIPGTKRASAPSGVKADDSTKKYNELTLKKTILESELEIARLEKKLAELKKRQE